MNHSPVPPFSQLPHSPYLGIIGVQHSDTPDDWGACIARVIRHEFEQVGGRTFFLNRIIDPAKPYVTPSQAVSSMLSRGVQALAFIGVIGHPAEWSEFASAAARSGGPLVVISWHEMFLPIPHVFYDNGDAGMAAAQHLLEAGCRQLAFLAPSGADWVELRIRGARQAVQQGHFPDASLQVYPNGYRALEAIYPSPAMEAAARDLLSGAAGPGACPARPLGIIAAQDIIGFQVLDAARSLGKVPGRDFALIGFDDIPLSHEMELSSLRPPLEAMGTEAASMLIRQFLGDRSRMRTCLTSQLIQRASSRLAQ